MKKTAMIGGKERELDFYADHEGGKISVWIKQKRLAQFSMDEECDFLPAFIVDWQTAAEMAEVCPLCTADEVEADKWASENLDTEWVYQPYATCAKRYWFIDMDAFDVRKRVCTGCPNRKCPRWRSD